MKKPLIYLATPFTYQPETKEIGVNKPDYSEKYRAVKLERFNIVNQVAAKLFMSGFWVFSPISMTHPIAEEMPIEADSFDLWINFDFYMLSMCDMLFVLCIDGWKESKGVNEEINFAKENSIPIVYINADLQILEG